MTTEEMRNAHDDADDLLFLKSMENGFKETQQRYSRCWERLQCRTTYVEITKQELLLRADKALVWYAKKLQDIKNHEAQLAADKESFVLEAAVAEMAQAEAAKKAAAADSELTQCKVNLDVHEEELAAREEKLAATLHAKDEEIQALLAK